MNIDAPVESEKKSEDAPDTDSSEEDEISFFTYGNSQPIDFTESQAVNIDDDDDDDDDVLWVEPLNKKKKTANITSKAVHSNDISINSNDDDLTCTTSVDTAALRRQIEIELESNAIIQKANSMVAEVLRHKSSEQEDSNCKILDEDEDKSLINYSRSNKLVRIPIRIDGKIRRYKLLETEPFKVIAEKIAQEEKIDVDQVLLSRKDLDIKVDDTPQSIKFSVTDILDFFAMKKPSQTDQLQDTEIIAIKIQSDSKNAFKKTFSVNQFKPLEATFLEYAKFRQIPLSSIVFYVDGEKIDFQNTPNTLALESGDVIDARVVTDST